MATEIEPTTTTIMSSTPTDTLDSLITEPPSSTTTPSTPSEYNISTLSTTIIPPSMTTIPSTMEEEKPSSSSKQEVEVVMNDITNKDNDNDVQQQMSVNSDNNNNNIDIEIIDNQNIYFTTTTNITEEIINQSQSQPESQIELEPPLKSSLNIEQLQMNESNNHNNDLANSADSNSSSGDSSTILFSPLSSTSIDNIATNTTTTTTNTDIEKNNNNDINFNITNNNYNNYNYQPVQQSNLDNLNRSQSQNGSQLVEEVYCVCRRGEYGFMVCCQECNEWFHGPCVGISKESAAKINYFMCPLCHTADSCDTFTINIEYLDEKKAAQEALRLHKAELEGVTLINTPNQFSLLEKRKRVGSIETEYRGSGMDNLPKTSSSKSSLNISQDNIEGETKKKKRSYTPRKKLSKSTMGINKEGAVGNEDVKDIEKRTVEQEKGKEIEGEGREKENKQSRPTEKRKKKSLPKKINDNNNGTTITMDEKTLDTSLVQDYTSSSGISDISTSYSDSNGNSSSQESYSDSSSSDSETKKRKKRKTPTRLPKNELSRSTSGSTSTTKSPTTLKSSSPKLSTFSSTSLNKSSSTLSSEGLSAWQQQLQKSNNQSQFYKGRFQSNEKMPDPSKLTLINPRDQVKKQLSLKNNENALRHLEKARLGHEEFIKRVSQQPTTIPNSSSRGSTTSSKPTPNLKSDKEIQEDKRKHELEKRKMEKKLKQMHSEPTQQQHKQSTTTSTTTTLNISDGSPIQNPIDQTPTKSKSSTHSVSDNRSTVQSLLFESLLTPFDETFLKDIIKTQMEKIEKELEAFKGEEEEVKTKNNNDNGINMDIDKTSQAIHLQQEQSKQPIDPPATPTVDSSTTTISDQKLTQNSETTIIEPSTSILDPTMKGTTIEQTTDTQETSLTLTTTTVENETGKTQSPDSSVKSNVTKDPSTLQDTSMGDFDPFSDSLINQSISPSILQAFSTELVQQSQPNTLTEVDIHFPPTSSSTFIDNSNIIFENNGNNPSSFGTNPFGNSQSTTSVVEPINVQQLSSQQQQESQPPLSMEIDSQNIIESSQPEKIQLLSSPPPPPPQQQQQSLTEFNSQNIIEPQSVPQLERYEEFLESLLIGYKQEYIDYAKEIAPAIFFKRYDKKPITRFPTQDRNEIAEISKQIEAAFYSKYEDPSKIYDYKTKSRSLVFNIKNNPELRNGLLTFEISPKDISEMSVEDWANKSLAELRKELHEKQMSQIVLPGEQKTIIKKTHKGDVEVEYVGASNSQKNLSTAAVSISIGNIKGLGSEIHVPTTVVIPPVSTTSTDPNGVYVSYNQFDNDNHVVDYHDHHDLAMSPLGGDGSDDTTTKNENDTTGSDLPINENGSSPPLSIQLFKNVLLSFSLEKTKLRSFKVKFSYVCGDQSVIQAFASSVLDQIQFKHQFPTSEFAKFILVPSKTRSKSVFILEPSSELDRNIYENTVRDISRLPTPILRAKSDLKTPKIQLHDVYLIACKTDELPDYLTLPNVKSSNCTVDLPTSTFKNTLIAVLITRSLIKKSSSSITNTTISSTKEFNESTRYSLDRNNGEKMDIDTDFGGSDYNPWADSSPPRHDPPPPPPPPISDSGPRHSPPRNDNLHQSYHPHHHHQPQQPPPPQSLNHPHPPTWPHPPPYQAQPTHPSHPPHPTPHGYDTHYPPPAGIVDPRHPPPQPTQYHAGYPPPAGIVDPRHPPPPQPTHYHTPPPGYPPYDYRYPHPPPQTHGYPYPPPSHPHHSPPPISYDHRYPPPPQATPPPPPRYYEDTKRPQLDSRGYPIYPPDSRYHQTPPPKNPPLNDETSPQPPQPPQHPLPASDEMSPPPSKDDEIHGTFIHPPQPPTQPQPSPTLHVAADPILSLDQIKKELEQTPTPIPPPSTQPEPKIPSSTLQIEEKEDGELSVPPSPNHTIIEKEESKTLEEKKLEDSVPGPHNALLIIPDPDLIESESLALDQKVEEEVSHPPHTQSNLDERKHDEEQRFALLAPHHPHAPPPHNPPSHASPPHDIQAHYPVHPHHYQTPQPPPNASYPPTYQQPHPPHHPPPHYPPPDQRYPTQPQHYAPPQPPHYPYPPYHYQQQTAPPPPPRPYDYNQHRGYPPPPPPPPPHQPQPHPYDQHRGYPPPPPPPPHRPQPHYSYPPR